MTFGKLRTKRLAVFTMLTVIVIIFYFFITYADIYENMNSPPTFIPRVIHPATPFTDSFNSTFIIEEAPSLYTSSNQDWWLDSGGILTIMNGIGATQRGPISQNSFWQKTYASSNALDTGNGYYPQNIFRLLTRGITENMRQELRFFIDALNETDTPNRGAWSGVFLMNRYIDKDNLYYAGIRIDGYAIIKKKINGVYYTLAYTKVFSPNITYNRETTPNLLPEKHWMRIKSEVITQPNDTVQISLWLDATDSGAYRQIFQLYDSKGAYNGTDIIHGAGHGGVRTDYLDVLFDEYVLTAFP